MKKRIEKNKKSIERKKQLTDIARRECETYEQYIELELSNRELLTDVINDITKNYL